LFGKFLKSTKYRLVSAQCDQPTSLLFTCDSYRRGVRLSVRHTAVLCQNDANYITKPSLWPSCHSDASFETCRVFPEIRVTAQSRAQNEREYKNWRFWIDDPLRSLNLDLWPTDLESVLCAVNSLPTATEVDRNSRDCTLQTVSAVNCLNAFVIYSSTIC